MATAELISANIRRCIKNSLPYEELPSRIKGILPKDEWKLRSVLLRGRSIRLEWR